jgi:hypothetical protein
MKKIKVLRSLFGGLLEPLGFSGDPVGHAIFRRRVSDEINHVVGPALTVAGDRFEVWAYPNSPIFGSDAEYMGPLPGMCYFLNDLQGVGSCQQSWPCEDQEEMKQDFEHRVKPLILAKAIPYLDRIRTIADFIPLIGDYDPTAEWFRGVALLHCGRRNEAKRAFLKERERLQRLKTEIGRMMGGKPLPKIPDLADMEERFRLTEEYLAELQDTR